MQLKLEKEKLVKKMPARTGVEVGGGGGADLCRESDEKSVNSSQR